MSDSLTSHLFIASVPSLSFAGSARPLVLLSLLPDLAPSSSNFQNQPIALDSSLLSGPQYLVWSVDERGVWSLGLAGFEVAIGWKCTKDEARLPAHLRGVGLWLWVGATGTPGACCRSGMLGKGRVPKDPSRQSMQTQTLSHGSASTQPETHVGNPTGAHDNRRVRVSEEGHRECCCFCQTPGNLKRQPIPETGQLGHVLAP